MTVEDYMRLFQPAMIEAAELLVEFESKYGEGIVFSQFDAACGAGHLISSLARCIKVVLQELN